MARGHAPTVPLHFAQLQDQRQPLLLDLSDALASNPEFFANLAKGVLLAVPHAGSHSQDVGGSGLKFL